MPLAVSFTVSGLHGWLVLFAVLAFAVAAIIAWFAPAHKAMHALVAAGLAVLAFAQLISG